MFEYLPRSHISKSRFSCPPMPSHLPVVDKRRNQHRWVEPKLPQLDFEFETRKLLNCNFNNFLPPFLVTLR